MGCLITQTAKGFTARSRIVPGLRFHLGTFRSRSAALRADREFQDTGVLPESSKLVFKHVQLDENGQWMYSYQGELHGPYETQLEAAHQRRRRLDNEAQRARRAGTTSTNKKRGRESEVEEEEARSVEESTSEPEPEPAVELGLGWGRLAHDEDDPLLIDYTGRWALAPWGALGVSP